MKRITLSNINLYDYHGVVEWTFAPEYKQIDLYNATMTCTYVHDFISAN